MEGIGITLRRTGITTGAKPVGSRVTRKGQVTIPKRVREHLGLEPGSVVDFELAADGRVVLTRPGASPPSRFARMRGIATVKMTTDEIMALTRGDD
jgi:antitoxin PrlF